MKLFDILKQQGLFSNEIKSRIKNKQLKINGNAIESNIDLEIEIDESEKKIRPVVVDSGTFISSLLIEFPDSVFSLQMKIFEFENLFESNIKNDLTDIFNQFILITISKKESFILKKEKLCLEENQ